MNTPSKQTTYQPVTLIFSWDVLPGKESAFTEWLHGISKASSHWAGHLGVTTLRPPSGKGTYYSVLRFDTDAHLKTWLDSEERHIWIEQLRGIAEVHTTKATGLETWFDIPGQSVVPPPRWKMVLVTFVAVYPLSLLLGAFISPHLIHWNLFLRALLFPIVAPTLLTYVLLPFLTQRVFKRWLYRAAKAA
jgi:antibiotic biosynthesis monooxygenase (ABM) superfamily enzyme